MAVTNRLIVGDPKPGLTWWREDHLVDSGRSGLQAILIFRVVTNRLIVGDSKSGEAGCLVAWKGGGYRLFSFVGLLLIDYCR